MHGLAGDDTGSLKFDSLSLLRLNGACAIDGVTQAVHDAAEHAFADGHIDNGAGTLHDISFLDFTTLGLDSAYSGPAGPFEENLPIVAQDHNTHVVSFQVERHTLDGAVAELDHLTGLDLSETEHASNTVTDRNNSTEFFKIVLKGSGLTLLGGGAYHLGDVGHLLGKDGHGVSNGGLLGQGGSGAEGALGHIGHSDGASNLLQEL